MPSPIILKKTNSLIKMAKTPCLIQQQFFNFLLAASRAAPDGKNIHTIPLSILLYYLDTTRDTTRNKKLIEDFKDLATKSVFNETPQTGFHLFESINVVRLKPKSPNSCIYSFSPHVNTLIKAAKRCTPINLLIIRALTSKHALALYELCMMHKESPWLDLGDLLCYLNLSNSIYKKFKVFNSKILKKAIQEINEKTDITVKINYQKEAKTVVRLKFVTKKNSLERFFIDYLAQNTKLMPKIMQPKTKGRPSAPKILCSKKELTLILRVFGISITQLAKKCPIYTITAYDLDKILGLFKTNQKNVLFIYTWLHAHYRKSI